MHINADAATVGFMREITTLILLKHSKIARTLSPNKAKATTQIQFNPNKTHKSAKPVIRKTVLISNPNKKVRARLNVIDCFLSVPHY